MAEQRKQLEPDDPYALVGVVFAVEEEEELDRQMARTIVEEYALLGMPRQKVWRLFRSPFFRGTHAILERRGEAFVREVIDEVFGPVSHVEPSEEQ